MAKKKTFIITFLGESDQKVLDNHPHKGPLFDFLIYFINNTTNETTLIFFYENETGVLIGEKIKELFSDINLFGVNFYSDINYKKTFAILDPMVKRVNNPIVNINLITKAIFKVIKNILETTDSPQIILHTKSGTPQVAQSMVIIPLVFPALQIQCCGWDHFKKQFIVEDLSGLQKSLLESLIGHNDVRHVFDPVDLQLISIAKSYAAVSATECDEGKRPTPVFLTGETGTGKEIFAEVIAGHYLETARLKLGFHSVNCAGLTETLADSLLFGHAKGSFTGADAEKKSMFEENACVFLDEIGELPAAVQSKLLRFLESGEYQPLGANKVKQSSCFIISATNKPGALRTDLLFRLSTFHIQLRPLREKSGEYRRELITRMLQTMTPGSKLLQILDEDAVDYLCSHAFQKGNYRELRSLLRRALAIRNLSDQPVTKAQVSLFHESILSLLPSASSDPMESIELGEYLLKKIERNKEKGSADPWKAMELELKRSFAIQFEKKYPHKTAAEFSKLMGMVQKTFFNWKNGAPES